MKTEHLIILGISLGVIAIAAVLEVRAGDYKKGPEITIETIKTGTTNPKIWLYYNNSEVNSRNWDDFGARSSRVLNIPLLNLLYETIVKANGDKYTVEVIGGLTGVAELLGSDAIPSQMKRNGSVGTAEEDWIRTAILAKYGGLWLSPSVISIRGFGALPKDKVVAFGQDDSSMYGTANPGFRALWSPYPNHPQFIECEKRIRERLDGQFGGLQIRGDAKSDWHDIFGGHDDVEMRIRAEFGRKADGKKLELEDIFSNTVNIQIPHDAVYMVIPYSELLDRRIFGWTLKISEEDLLSSSLFISNLLNDLLMKDGSK